MAELTLDLARSAATLLDGVAARTPVITSRQLDAVTGATVLAKAENLQRTGSFKFRGAYHAMARALNGLTPHERARGVCTVSSGNHAQAVALAARLLGVPAAVMMPEDSPPVKRAAVEGYGAEVVTFDRWSEPQGEAGARLQRERGVPLISSHDHPDVSAGAATALLELLEEGGPVDVLLAAVGGGGGMAGYATVVRALQPAARIVAVEPQVSGLLQASLAAGSRIERPVPRTVADGLQLTRIGELPLRVMADTVDAVVEVGEDEITAAMRFAFERMKTVLEPSGATALAAALSGRAGIEGRRVAVVLTGGNIGIEAFARLTGGAG